MRLSMRGRNYKLNILSETEYGFTYGLISESPVSESTDRDENDARNIANQQLATNNLDDSDYLIDDSVLSTKHMPKHYQVHIVGCDKSYLLCVCSNF